MAGPPALASTYEPVAFEDLHPPLCALLGDHIRFVLDIGAGSGRDAAALARLGYDVTAVEPSKEMRKQGALHHPNVAIRWIDDRLPDLVTLHADERRYDLILLSAVIMHLHPEEMAPSFRRVGKLLDRRGLAYVTLRRGPGEPDRDLRSVKTETVIEAAAGARLELLQTHEIPDRLDRFGISWEVLILRHERL